MGPSNHVLYGDQDRTNPFTAMRGTKTAMRPVVKLLWTLVLEAEVVNLIHVFD